MLSPLAATRLNRPNRSTNITVACGTILIVFTAMTSRTMPMKNRVKIRRKLPTTSAWNSINDASDMNHLRRLPDYDGVHYISVRTESGSDRITGSVVFLLCASLRLGVFSWGYLLTQNGSRQGAKT